MPVTSTAIQGGLGLVQGVAGLFGGNSAQKKLEKLQTPTYQPNRAIGDYYNQALARYSANPYDTQAYGVARNNALAGTAAGLNALGGRRSALAGVGKLVGIQDNALGRAAAEAENRRTQAFGQLGSATNMKAADDRTAFQYNKVMPYEKQAALLGAKASGYNKLLSAGIQNLFGGASGFSQIMGARRRNITQNPYQNEGVGLADTGGPSILNQPSVAANYPYINPNGYSNF